MAVIKGIERWTETADGQEGMYVLYPIGYSVAFSLDVSPDIAMNAFRNRREQFRQQSGIIEGEQ